MESLRLPPRVCPPRNVGRPSGARSPGVPLRAKISETPFRPAFSVGGGEGNTHEDEGKWCCDSSQRFGSAWRGAECGRAKRGGTQRSAGRNQNASRSRGVRQG